MWSMNQRESDLCQLTRVKNQKHLWELRTCNKEDISILATLKNALVNYSSCAKFAADSISLGLEVILTVNANKHVVKGKLARHLRSLSTKEAYCKNFNPEGGPASCFSGKH